MKIVMICDFYGETLEYQENLLAKYYVKSGHEVTIITSLDGSLSNYISESSSRAGQQSTYVRDSVKIIRLPFRHNLREKIRIFPSLMPIFAQEQPDLLFFHDIVPNIVDGARYVRSNPQCRMIMDYHADYTNSGNGWLSQRVLHGVIRKYMLDRARPQLSKIFPVVPASAQFLRDLYGVPDSEMELLPLGADTDTANAVHAASEGRAVRATLNIPDEAFVVFTGGKFHPLKQTEDLLTAIPLVDRPNVHVIVVGDAPGVDDPYVAQLHAAAQGNPAIHFIGWQPSAEVYRRMDAADVAVFPASQSVLWQQSIGMGLPLIVGDRIRTSPVRQDVAYLNANGNVLTLDPLRPLPGQIAEHLRRLIDNPAERATMAAGARKTSADVLSYHHIVAQTLRHAATN